MVLEVVVVVATALINQVIEKLSSAVIKGLGLLWGMRDDLNRLQSTLSTINAVLEDAEERSVKENNPLLRDWLTKLKDAAYDADDLVDDLEIEAPRQQLELRCPTIKEVCAFFTSSNPGVFWVMMSLRINGMRGRLKEIDAERTNFGLKERPIRERETWSTMIKERETWSKLDDEKTVCGRDGDVETIMRLLLTEENDDGPNINVSIVSIVGMGGLGKTTLAQLVYKRVEEKKLFDLRIWVYVSQDFDPTRIAKKAIESATENECKLEAMESVGKRLAEALKDKRFLVVLDDVWNENQDEWENKLKPMLNDGKKGSKILVTTRDPKIASMMGSGTTGLYTLRQLSDEACWELFKQRAFVRRRGGVDKGKELAEEINSQFEQIGWEISKKCGGVPLAAKTLGGVMMFKKTLAEWKAVRDDDIWKLPEVNKGVIAPLRLSYSQLSPQVKQCFAYCSMFPKGKTIEKEELISQWIAQGFLPSDEIGDRYLDNLLQLSFLQELSDDHSWCTMHDLVHDLAASVAGDDVVMIKTKEEMAAGILKAGCRYATVVGVYSPLSKAAAKSFKKVRAFRVRSYGRVPMINSMCNLRSLDLSDTLMSGSLHSWLKTFKKLRYLRVRLLGETVLPGSLCSLESLQALYLSGCSKVESIPESIGGLRNLRSLRLIDCEVVESYPDSIGNLENLRILDLSRNKRLKQLPDTICRLKNLRRLKLSECEELKALPESVGDLVLLEEMDLPRCYKLVQLPDSIVSLKNLRRLDLSVCGELKALPESVADLENLEEMDLSWCKKLEHLPDSIGRLKNLRRLNLDMCYELKALPKYVAGLVQLEEINLSNCWKLEQLPDSIGRLKNLRRLNLFACPELKALPKFVAGLVHLEEINLSYCSGLEQLPDSIGSLKNLRRLNLSICIELKALPESVAHLVHLEEMDLSGCEKLVQLPDSIGRLENLQRLILSECKELKALPETVTDLAHLEEMDLSNCLELQELPKGLGIKMRNLRTLSLFIVGEEEEGFCNIASLAHMNQLEGKLTIKKLERLVRNPLDAKKANLEKKENLRKVAFEWSSRDREEEGDDTATAAAATVFEHLLPPPGIEKLTIDGYPGTKYPNWMMQIGSHYSFPKLTNIKFVDHKRCDRLPPLGVLPSLERLQLKGMHGIRTIVDELNGGAIGSASSLERISFIDMPNFEEWTNDGQPMTIFPNLMSLTIRGCSLLKAQPCLPPSIEELILESSNEELLSSKSLGMLSSMSELRIKNCSAQLGWQGLRHLTGLTELYIEECPVLSELPECIGDLQSLLILEISSCDRLTTMPHFLRRLTDLESLTIIGCPQLESRCEEETGEDWSNISHIPEINIIP